MNTNTYSNAARAGRTHHGQIEIRSKDHDKFAIRVSPGYMGRFNDQTVPNRARRRATGRYRGFSQPGYLKLPSLRTLGLHPAQQDKAVEA